MKASLLSILKLSINESKWLPFELLKFSSTIEIETKIKNTIHTIGKRQPV